jgi:hypothetical protein
MLGLWQSAETASSAGGVDDHFAISNQAAAVGRTFPGGRNADRSPGFTAEKSSISLFFCEDLPRI